MNKYGQLSADINNSDDKIGKGLASGNKDMDNIGKVWIQKTTWILKAEYMPHGNIGSHVFWGFRVMTVTVFWFEQ